MGCLSVNIRDEGQHLNVGVKMVNPLLAVDSRLLNAPLSVNCSLICDVNSEDDKDIVSMLFNELMIGNNTLFVNGDAPSQILEMLHNGQMLTNETLLVDTSVIVIKERESSTRILNKYYLKN